MHYGPNGPDAIIVVTGGEFRSMRALLSDRRRLGFRPRPTRIRGHRGQLHTRRLGPVTRTLAWVEGGVVYSIGSGTPRKVSLAQLRSTAGGLDRLGGAWIGASSDPNSSSEGFAVTTAHTVSVNVARRDSAPWAGTVTGTISPTAITLQVRATGTIEDYVCDSGPVVLTLAHQGAGA